MGNPQIENGYTAIANELLDELCKIRINGEAVQVLLFIFRKTYGWNKKKDAIALSQFEKFTNINRPNIVRAIHKLKEMNIIIIEKDNEIGNIYCINKKYSTWKPLSKKITLSKKIMTVIEKDKESLSKKIHTKDNYTKDTITKDIASELPADWRDLFTTWLEYKKERGEKYKSIKSIRVCYKNLVQLSGNNLLVAEKIVEQSMANNWAGLFPLKNNYLPNNNSKAERTIENARRAIQTINNQTADRNLFA